jgi:hypothetical protein
VEQRLEVITYPHQADVVAAFPQRVSDLILHFRLVRLPGRYLQFQLPLMVLVVPVGVGSVENNGDAHRPNKILGSRA